MMRGLRWDELVCHLAECGIELLIPAERIRSVVMRTGDGTDHGLAAVHREGDVLVLDLGLPMTEV
jgi:hypothetical protein